METLHDKTVYVAGRKEDCCGCFACASICAHNAIEMAEDEEGFFYALKKETCVNCGLCLRVCPFTPPMPNQD